MSVTRRIARPLLAGMFVVGGLGAARDPKSKADAADTVVTPLMEAMGMRVATVDAVRANGIAQVVGGVMLAFGAAPRLAAAVLASSIVPTTLAGHRFWEEEDPNARSGQQVQFLKNAAVLGGLLLAVVDTESEPSVSWRAHRALERIEERLPTVPHFHDA